MKLHKEILDNINSRFVLLKKNTGHLIIDKNRRTSVLIEDPLINTDLLIKSMIEAGVTIYNNPKELPEPTEFPIDLPSITENIRVFIKKIYDENRVETGSIISALLTSHIGQTEKKRIENLMENYAFSVLYPGQGLNLYSEVNDDTASLTVIKNINNLPNQDLSWTPKDIYNW
jgi:hypothetical protein